LKAAIAYAAAQKNYNHMVHLVIELSTIEAGNEKGFRYIVDNPDMIVLCQDIDSTRRLFEMRTRWQGTRHARLTIAHLLQDELSEASRHAVRANEWIWHYREQRDFQKPGPTQMDISAIALWLISQGRYKEAASYMRIWKDWYAYEVAEHVFSILATSKALHSERGLDAGRFVEAMQDEVGALAAALSLAALSEGNVRISVEKVSKICRKKKKIESNERQYGQSQTIEDGLLRAAAVALGLGLKAEAMDICRAIVTRRPSLSMLTDKHANPYSRQYIFPFIFHRVLQAKAEGRKISAQDILPTELNEICPIPDLKIDDEAFKIRLKGKIFDFVALDEKMEKHPERRRFSYEARAEANHFLDGRLPSYLQMLLPFGELLCCKSGEADRYFIEVVKSWSQVRRNQSDYRTGEFDAFFDAFGQRVILFSLSARMDLTTAAFGQFMRELEGGHVFTTTLIELVAIFARNPLLHEIAGTIAKRAGLEIDGNDEVSYRATLYSRLSRAILPVSKDDAVKFFRTGLEQMDIVGSGDYDFINGLMALGSSIEGTALEEKDFHTFTNMCELNIYEVDKFDWHNFGCALAKIAGFPGMAKLCRWDDRSKVSLSYSLMPFLTALVKVGKIDPDLALCLLRLCNPFEMRGYDFQHFAATIFGHPSARPKELAVELFRQFKANEPSLVSSERVDKLIPHFEAALGVDAPEVKALKILERQSETSISERNANYNFKHNPILTSDHEASQRFLNRKIETKAEVERILREVATDGQEKIFEAVEAFQKIPSAYEYKEEFFGRMRESLPFAERPKYVQAIASHQVLDFYWKLEELQRCKERWNSSSSSLGDVFNGLAYSLLTNHADDLTSHSCLSVYKMAEISKITGVEMGKLTLDLIAFFASSDMQVPATVWMELAAMICRKADDGEPQAALCRLLEGNAQGVWLAGL
jgi:hypothetical protein